MKRFLTIAAAIALVVGGLVLVLWDVPNWRLYDKNWAPLAMTEAENFCAGKLLGERNDNVQDVAYMEDCTTNSGKDNTTPNIAQSVRWACEGLNSIIHEFPVQECMDTVEGYQIWFLKDGGFTMAWAESGSNKRPVVASKSIVDAPPRGEREDSGRELP